MSAVKNAHHLVETDKPGKDSYRYRMAGAEQVILCTPERWAMFTECREKTPTLDYLVSHLDPVDILLVEGFKSETETKALRIEVWRELGASGIPICADDRGISAVVTDSIHPAFRSLSVLDINDPHAVAGWVCKQLRI